MRKNRSLWLVLFVVAAMVLAACGNGDAADDGDTGDTGDTGTTTTTQAAGDTGGDDGDTGDDGDMEEVTLRVLIHQNPPLTAYMEQFNADFEANNPGVTVAMTVVDPGDMATSIQTRLSAADVDIIDYCVAPCAGFSNALQPYMSGISAPPTWQQLIEAGLVMDLTGQPFVANFDEASIQDAGSFDGKVYAINMGRVSYSGMFVNLDLLADVGVDVPTTWSELLAVCEAVDASGNACMTQGGADGWPLFVGAYGLLGSIFPDQAALVEGLWTGDIKWNEGKGLEFIEKSAVYAQELLEPGVTGLGHNEATARYAAGDVAFLPTGIWQAPTLEDAAPGFDWTYVPFPGSDNADDNQYLFGKYDMSWMAAADTPHPDVAMAYLAALSDPTNYQAFVDAIGFLPTQPTATLGSKLGEAVNPLLPNYRVGFEQYWVSPTGAGQWANGSLVAQWFTPFNEWETAAELANQVQIDLDAGLSG